MKWIRVASLISRDASVRQIARTSGCSVHAAIGHLVMLWGAMTDEAKDGNLAGVHDEDLEAWAEWSGKACKAGRFAAAVRASLCEADGQMRSWEKYQGAAIREHESDRKRKSGKTPPDDPPDSGGTPPEKPRNSGGGSNGIPSPTSTRTREEILPASCPAGEPDRSDRPTPSAVARILVIAANQAVADVWGESTAPYLPANGPSHELAVVVLDEGIPVDLARSAVFTACKAFCAKAKARGDLQRRPNAMSYFAKPVRDAWASAQAKDDATHAARPAELSAPPGTGVVPFQRFPSAAERLSERSRANTRIALDAIRAEREQRAGRSA